MKLEIYQDKASLGRAAARAAAGVLTSCQARAGGARIIAATGASQFEFLAALTATPGLAWANVEMFHLDEYVGLPLTHPASFRKYLLERLIQPAGIGRYHLLNAETEVEKLCQTVGEKLNSAPVDVAFVGIGENGHLAFNDPPADFQSEAPYIVVALDQACRQQQVGEGWFPNLDAVPRQAVSMSIRQIMKAKKILCIVPDLRKARAVQACLEGPVNPDAPASILQTHPDVKVYLDPASASLLARQPAPLDAD